MARCVTRNESLGFVETYVEAVLNVARTKPVSILCVLSILVLVQLIPIAPPLIGTVTAYRPNVGFCRDQSRHAMTASKPMPRLTLIVVVYVKPNVLMGNTAQRIPIATAVRATITGAPQHHVMIIFKIAMNQTLIAVVTHAPLA